MKCKLGAANEASQGLPWAWRVHVGHKGHLLSKAIKFHPIIITVVRILPPLQIQ